MTDRNSPIADFYPQDFETDMDGKRHDWQGVVLLPFVDEKRLVEAVAEKYESLTREDIARNEQGAVLLFSSKSNPFFGHAQSFFKNDLSSTKVSG